MTPALPTGAPRQAGAPGASGAPGAERRAVLDVLGASLLFAVCNVAWRYGEGPTTEIVFVRAALGAVLAWAIARRGGRQPWWLPLRTRAGALAVLTSGAGMIAAGTIFRSLDGPLAALAIACTPAVALLVRDRVGSLATTAALGSSAAAAAGISLAATDAGPAASIGVGAVAVAVAFVAIEVVSMRSSQLAVEQGCDPAAVVTASMVVAAVAIGPLAIAQGVGAGSSALLSSLVAATVVAVLGTLGRVLRTVALPAAGVPAVAASQQVTAVGTALGGVALLGDPLGVAGALWGVLAAGLGAFAVVAGTRWRLRRDGRLARPLDLGLEPAAD